MSWKYSLWPEWQIESEIGAGSYGTVYRIRRQDIGGTFYAALKVISVPRSSDEIQSLRNAKMTDSQIADYYLRFAKQLAQEFAVMERLKGNTNIVSYEDHKIVPRPDGFGVDVLIRMELLTPMNQFLYNGECTEDEAIKIGIDLCNALVVCEQEGLLHRDIKPGNVFVSSHGNFKLGDFSIAKMADVYSSGKTPQGTFSYMAPEIFSGEGYGKTIDLYSLGLILYRLLNGGRAPFLPVAPAVLTPNMADEANGRRLQGEALPPPINASPKMSQVILKACAYKSTDRYRSAGELREALESVNASNSMDIHTSLEGKLKNDPPMRDYFATAGDL